MADIYLVEEMGSHLFQVVKADGEELEKIDVLAAEGLDYRLTKRGLKVEWLDRQDLKERKHVRNLVAQYKARHRGCSFLSDYSGV